MKNENEMKNEKSAQKKRQKVETCVCCLYSTYSHYIKCSLCLNVKFCLHLRFHCAVIGLHFTSVSSQSWASAGEGKRVS